MARLWDTLAAPLTAAQASALELLLEIPDGARTSDLERLRRGPTRPGPRRALRDPDASDDEDR